MVKRDDTSTGRFYEIEGKKFPSVTTILAAVGKPALIKWAANEERKLMSEAAADLYEDTYGTPKLNRAGYIASLLDRAGKVKAFQRVSQKAADIGTQVHHRVEYAIRKELGQEAGTGTPHDPGGMVVVCVLGELAQGGRPQGQVRRAARLQPRRWVCRDA